MKRLMTTFLMALSAFALAGCGGTSSNTPSVGGSNSSGTSDATVAYQFVGSYYEVASQFASFDFLANLNSDNTGTLYRLTCHADETQNMNDVTDEHEVAPQVKPLFPLPDLRQNATDDEEARSREEFTTVYDVIDQMEQSLDQAKGALFAPGLIKVDRDEFADHLATLKKMLPVSGVKVQRRCS